MNEHQDQDDAQARALLLAHCVPVFADGVMPEAALRELARLSQERAGLIAQGGGGDARSARHGGDVPAHRGCPPDGSAPAVRGAGAAGRRGTAERRGTGD